MTCPAPRVRLAICRLLWIAICAGLTGCTSIYHRTWDKFPPEAHEELALRVSEARATERLGQEAVARLSRDLDHEVAAEMIQVDFDRIEMLALELQRRLLAAHDVLPQAAPDPSLVAEMDRLRRRSELWLSFVHVHRHADAATQARQIRTMLSEGDAKSAAPAH
jgi:hypothetical protein